VISVQKVCGSIPGHNQVKDWKIDTC